MMAGDEEDSDERWGHGVKGDRKRGADQRARGTVKDFFCDVEGAPSGDEFLFCVHHSTAVGRQVNNAFERIKYDSDNFDSYCLSKEKPKQ